ncbi:putative glutamine amidotransferase-like protein C13C5.04 [Golovinomyces cichoracearum]|uniref:Putative glutamine amidotransferase-like protein C13C5.04 n=1 Tax=Golovinomyces cichoracearum TaxID=62708 RepID=A0A420J1I4_9PEZI|nr:putative glutamine amidotransferase-like protein C13C5.04 [Golovinomyces cichoracearum]
MAPKRIAILKCGTLSAEAREKYTDYYNLFKMLLESAAERMNCPGCIETFCFDPREDTNWPVLDEIDAVLITGSTSSTFDSEPWITQVNDFVKTILAQDRVRLIGVCFGHQITARAIEGIGAVGRNVRGWELGVTNIDLTERGKEVFERDTLAIQQVHRDEVLYAPRGVEILGSSPKCAIQSMYIPNKLFTVQGHPEIKDDIISELVHSRYEDNIISEEEFNEAISREGCEHHGEVIGELFIKFLTQ